MKLKHWLLISLITLLGLFTRFYKLDNLPPGLTIDEVAIGYNAFSILKTGLDEWGNRLPVSFRSVGDYKSPTLIYLTVPFVKAFGLSDWSTRLPVALFSLLNIFFFFFLVKKYLISDKHWFLPYLATIIYSLSPWVIIFSRSGFEAILAQTFVLLNLYFIFKFYKNKDFLSFFSIMLFAFLSIITYHSTKIFSPLINFYFLFTNRNLVYSSVKGWYQRQKFFSLIFVILLGWASFFLIKNFVLGSGSARAGMTFLSKDFDFAQALLPTYQKLSFSGLFSVIGLFLFWSKRYLEYFSLNFYVSNGLGLTTSGFPGQGVIYLIELPFLLLAPFIYHRLDPYFNHDYQKLSKPILMVWLLFAFLPGSLTNNSQHALRTLNAAPVICLLIALSLYFLYEKIKIGLLKYLFVLLVLIGYFFGVSKFIDYYTLHYPIEMSEFRSYGWQEIAVYVNSISDRYDNVYIDPRFGTLGPYTYGTPHLYFLYYSAYDPQSYIHHPLRPTGSSDFANYHFGPIDYAKINQNHQKNLFVGSPWSFPTEVMNSDKVLLYVPFLNQASGLYVITN